MIRSRGVWIKNTEGFAILHTTVGQRIRIGGKGSYEVKAQAKVTIGKRVVRFAGDLPVTGPLAAARAKEPGSK